MNYREVIESKYNRAKWQELLHDIFGSKAKFWSTVSNASTSSQFAQQAWWLGTITLSDEQTIAVYEVELAESVDIERNRRGIRDMLLTNWRAKGCAGAFMFCYRKHESVLRFSYVSESWKFADDGTYQKESTDTKRFTYLLGEGHRSRTAIQQFETLKKSDLKLKDLTKAFSVDAVSDMFFDGYKKQYEDIIQYVTGKRMVKVANKWEERIVGEPCLKIMQEFAHFSNPEKSIRDYVKKLMGRLVFLQFLQKKGWLGVPVDGWWGDGDPEFLQTLFAQYDDKDNFVDNVLEPLFNDLNTEREGEISQLTVLGCQFKVPYLNGGLFEREATDQTSFPLPAKYMQNMLDFFSSYNFTIDENDPDDAEVGVDPEMLGRIFENLLEDNKDKGAFYTPKEIVSYMCRESLIAYLQTNIEDEPTKEAIREFVTTHNAAELGNLSESIDQRLKDVKICDPAIGSGAFPMGLLKELFQCRTAIEGIDQHQAAEIKKHIIQQNIYGVDIERGAVDIARLRFWLALIVDEDEPHALPNLDYKIMQGNSLISTFCGEYINLDTKVQNHTSTNRMRQTKRILLDLKRRFYTASGIEKDTLSIEIKDNILQLVSIQLGFELRTWAEQNAQTSIFPSPQQLSIKTIIQHLPPERQKIVQHGEDLRVRLKNENISIKNRAQIDIHFFDYRINFTEVFDNDTPGFNIIIGNPPYVKEYTNRSAFDGFRESSPYYMGKMDLWYGFACHGIDLLQDNGVLCFIAQNNWTTSAGAKKMRNKVIEDTQILQMLDFNTYMVFENADIQTMIMLFRRTQSIDNYNFDYRTITQGGEKEDMLALLGKQPRNTQYLIPSINKASFIDKLLTFSNNDQILETISEDKEYLKDDEVAQGIVFPQDFLNKQGANKLGNIYPIGTGIFGLNQSEKDSMHLNDNELSIIKPYFTTEQIQRYYTEPHNTLWLIYTDSSFKQKEKMNAYPNIKEHLDKFISIFTSDNKPYGLHRCRKQNFFQGEKIISLRKCVERPCFSYSDFDCYVTQTFFSIKTSRWNMKFLTGVLNSRLVAFWLRNKGKMQGNNYQVDKEPLQGIPLPIVEASQQQSIIELVDQILSLKQTNPSVDTSDLERQIDQLVYALYNLTPEEIAIIES